MVNHAPGAGSLAHQLWPVVQRVTTDASRKREKIGSFDLLHVRQRNLARDVEREREREREREKGETTADGEI